MDDKIREDLAQSAWKRDAAVIKPLVPPQEPPLPPGWDSSGANTGQETSYTEDGKMVNFSAGETEQ